MSGPTVEDDRCRVHFEAEVDIQFVEYLQDRQKPFGKIVKALLQEFLTGWRKVLTNGGKALVVRSQFVEIFRPTAGIFSIS